MRTILDIFFQAEDGIRDRNVTGVQTCALPISGKSSSDPFHAGISALPWYASTDEDEPVPAHRGRSPLPVLHTFGYGVSPYHHTLRCGNLFALHKKAIPLKRHFLLYEIHPCSYPDAVPYPSLRGLPGSCRPFHEASLLVFYQSADHRFSHPGPPESSHLCNKGRPSRHTPAFPVLCGRQVSQTEP